MPSEEGFAKPLAKVIKDLGPPNAVVPTGGFGLTLNDQGRIPDPGVLAKFSGTAGTLQVDTAGAVTWATTSSSTALVEIADTTLGAATASIDLTSLSQSYLNLTVVFTLRGDTAAKSTAAWVRLNNQSGGTAYLSSAGFDSKAVIGTMPASTNSDTVACMRGVLWIPLYTATGVSHVVNGTYAARVNDGGTAADFAGGAISAVCGVTTAFGAIDRITFLPAAGNLTSGSRVVVYGSV